MQHKQPDSLPKTTKTGIFGGPYLVLRGQIPITLIIGNSRYQKFHYAPLCSSSSPGGVGCCLSVAFSAEAQAHSETWGCASLLPAAA